MTESDVLTGNRSHSLSFIKVEVYVSQARSFNNIQYIQ